MRLLSTHHLPHSLLPPLNLTAESLLSLSRIQMLSSPSRRPAQSGWLPLDKKLLSVVLLLLLEAQFLFQEVPAWHASVVPVSGAPEPTVISPLPLSSTLPPPMLPVEWIMLPLRTPTPNYWVVPPWTKDPAAKLLQTSRPSSVPCLYQLLHTLSQQTLVPH